MIIETIEIGNMKGCVEYNPSGSYIVRVNFDGQPLHHEVYGNGVTAEDRLLELLEFPEWTALKYC